MTPISKEPTIRAYGLETRYYTHDPVRGYGCAECCNGDRCDEDCTAKYKGNRAGCPHCKGKGWIKAEDLDPVLPVLSRELQDQIEREANAFKKEPHYTNGSSLSSGPQIYLKRGYIAGATAYAHYKERCEELERWKREADSLLSPLLDYGQSKEANIPLGASITAVILQRAKQFEQAKKALKEILVYCEESGLKKVSVENPVHMAVYHSLHAANNALASWKEEGKEVDR